MPQRWLKIINRNKGHLKNNWISLKMFLNLFSSISFFSNVLSRIFLKYITYRYFNGNLLGLLREWFQFSTHLNLILKWFLDTSNFFQNLNYFFELLGTKFASVQLVSCIKHDKVRWCCYCCCYCYGKFIWLRFTKYTKRWDFMQIRLLRSTTISVRQITQTK